MIHYLMQISDVDLVASSDKWKPQGGPKFIAHYPQGQAFISGPIPVGNPNKPWFEIIASNQATIDALSALASESMPMHEAVTSRGPMRAAYKSRSRRLIRNSGGKPVGVLCDFTIYGIDPVSSSLGGRDPEDMPELLDLE